MHCTPHQLPFYGSRCGQSSKKQSKELPVQLSWAMSQCACVSALQYSTNTEVAHIYVCLGELQFLKAEHTLKAVLTHKQTHTRVLVHTDTNTNTHTQLCKYIRTTYTHKHSYMYTHTGTHVREHTHTHTHT